MHRPCTSTTILVLGIGKAAASPSRVDSIGAPSLRQRMVIASGLPVSVR
jgi:hypothetical protein